MKTNAWRRTIIVRWTLALTLLASSACNDGSCEVEGHEFDEGTRFTCGDGCNGCVCRDGQVEATQKECSMRDPDAAYKLHCAAGDGWVAHGRTFACDGACCRCDDGEVKRSDESC